MKQELSNLLGVRKHRQTGEQIFEWLDGGNRTINKGGNKLHWTGKHFK